MLEVEDRLGCRLRAAAIAVSGKAPIDLPSEPPAEAGKIAFAPRPAPDDGP